MISPVMPDNPKTTRQLVFELLRERPTMTDTQLSRALGVSRQRILQIRTSGREGPLHGGRPPGGSASTETVVETYERLKHVGATALALGISPYTARLALAKACVPVTKKELDRVTSRLVVEVKSGKLVREAAAIVGISYTAARRRLERAHVATKPDPPPLASEVSARYEAGASIAELADYYGVCRQTVARILRANGTVSRHGSTSRSIVASRRTHMMPNSAHVESLLDDPKALVATLPHEKQMDLVMASYPPVEEDEENLPPHLRKMLTGPEDVG